MSRGQSSICHPSGIEPAQGEVSRFHLGGEEKSFILFLGDKGSAVGNREGFYGGDRDIIALYLCEYVEKLFQKTGMQSLRRDKPKSPESMQ